MKRHIWKYDGHDNHKNHDDYVCTECGTTDWIPTYGNVHDLKGGPCPGGLPPGPDAQGKMGWRQR